MGKIREMVTVVRQRTQQAPAERRFEFYKVKELDKNRQKKKVKNRLFSRTDENPNAIL